MQDPAFVAPAPEIGAAQRIAGFDIRAGILVIMNQEGVPFLQHGKGGIQHPVTVRPAETGDQHHHSKQNQQDSLKLLHSTIPSSKNIRRGLYHSRFRTGSGFYAACYFLIRSHWFFYSLYAGVRF